jgi:hypothetical protein
LRRHPIHGLRKQMPIAEPGKCALQRDAVVLRQKRGFLSLAEFHDVPPNDLGGIIKQ